MFEGQNFRTERQQQHIEDFYKFFAELESDNYCQTIYVEHLIDDLGSLIISNTDCGTVACIAGWMDAFAGFDNRWGYYGLHPVGADDLFDSYVNGLTPGLTVPHKVAVRCLRHYIDTDVVDWILAAELEGCSYLINPRIKARLVMVEEV